MVLTMAVNRGPDDAEDRMLRAVADRKHHGGLDQKVDRQGSELSMRTR
jgi:hypothetical protein